MAIIQEEINEGLAFVDFDASKFCGVVLNRENIVSHIIRKPDGRPLLRLPANNPLSQKAAALANETEAYIGGKPLVLKPNPAAILSNKKMTLANFLTEWLSYQASNDEDPLGTAIDTLVTLRDATDPTAKESAVSAGHQGVLEIIFGDTPEKLPQSVYKHLCRYHEKLPRSKIGPSK